MTEKPDHAAIPSASAASSQVRPWVAGSALLLAVLALAGLMLVGVQGYAQLHSLENQLARRIGEFDAASRDARVAAKAANEALADLQTRLQALESRAQDTQNQQIALTAMYQELARSADERVLADIEQTLLLAQQQLQLAGNVKAALIGLEAADARLSQLAKPQFAALHKSIIKDIERLKLMPAADIEGMNARLEALIQGIDKLKPESDREDAPRKPMRPLSFGALGTLENLSREAWGEIKSLLRIRRLDHPDLPLLTPEQSFFLKQNLRLRLLTARLALLQRDETMFRVDIKAAEGWVGSYFNRQDAATRGFLEGLEKLQQAPVALQDAQINLSLRTLRAMRGTRE